MRPALPVLTAICGLVAALALAPVGFAGQPVTVPLNPAPPSFETCKAVGNGSICQGARTLPPYGPVDAGIPCGSGPNAFEVFDSGVESQVAIRYYDADGNLTRRVIHETYNSTFSNSLTGTSIPYNQKQAYTDVLAVPGDFGSATETVTGEVNFTAPGFGAVLLNAGRIVTGPDGTLEFSAGPQALWDYFVNGNTSAADELCAALGA